MSNEFEFVASGTFARIAAVRGVPDMQSKSPWFDSYKNRWGPNRIFRGFDEIETTYALSGKTSNRYPAYCTHPTITYFRRLLHVDQIENTVLSSNISISPANDVLSLSSWNILAPVLWSSPWSCLRCIFFPYCVYPFLCCPWTSCHFSQVLWSIHFIGVFRALCRIMVAVQIHKVSKVSTGYDLLLICVWNTRNGLRKIVSTTL